MLLLNKVFHDNRGWFSEFVKISGFAAVQTNISFSEKDVVRGIHFQKPPHNQAKLVRVLSGSVTDVVIDLNPASATYGLVEHFALTPEHTLYVPNTHGHAFWAHEPTHFMYQCDRGYAHGSEGGISPLDPALGLPWLGVDCKISDKDKVLPLFADFASPF